MKKVELLAPAGDLDKLKVALLYGADACFIGGKSFSLRAKASNFSQDDLKEAVKFAHSLNKKIHVTINVILEKNEIEKVKEYIDFLVSIKVDAVIVSSLAIMNYIKEKNYPIEVHVSTQCSSSNSKSVRFYQNLGAKRVVLARECSLEDIKKIKKSSDVEIETFIHGGLCSSISGRCHLSDFYTGRKANRGACAHSCRWTYDLDSKDDGKPFLFGCKDLCLLEYVGQLIEAGIDSFKIEGRMKSLHYIATVVRAYRKVIDAYYDNSLNENVFEEAYQELSRCESRNYGTSFIKGYIEKEDMVNSLEDKEANHEFVGYVKKENNKVMLFPKQLVFKDNTYEYISPSNKNNRIIKVIKLFNKKGEEILDTRHDSLECEAEFDFQIEDYGIIRRLNG